MKLWTARLVVVMSFASTSLLGISAEASDSVALIRYGTSYGKCIGYCSKSIEVFPARVAFIAIAYNQTKRLPAISNEAKLDKQEHEELRRLLKEASVNGLEERIGCPDCTDGGAEWIEIPQHGRFKRITFEKGKPPTQLRALTNWLGTLQGRFPVPSVR